MSTFVNPGISHLPAIAVIFNVFIFMGQRIDHSYAIVADSPAINIILSASNNIFRQLT